jgi:hypothetical protein
MDWLTALAIFGAVIAFLQAAEMAYKYGSPLYKKITTTRSGPRFMKASFAATCSTCNFVPLCVDHYRPLEKI